MVWRYRSGFLNSCMRVNVIFLVVSREGIVISITISNVLLIMGICPINSYPKIADAKADAVQAFAVR